MATVNLYLVRESEGARLFRRVTQPPNVPDIWIPRSVCSCVTKFPLIDEEKLRLCSVVLEDWFAEKKGLV